MPPTWHRRFEGLDAVPRSLHLPRTLQFERTTHVSQNRFPVTWLSVPGPKHPFLLGVVQFQSRGNPNPLSAFRKQNCHPSFWTWSLGRTLSGQSVPPWSVHCTYG